MSIEFKKNQKENRGDRGLKKKGEKKRRQIIFQTNKQSLQLDRRGIKRERV